MTVQTMVNEAAKTVWSYIDQSGQWGLTTNQDHLHNALEVQVASLEDFKDFGCLSEKLDCDTPMYEMEKFILADGNVWQGYSYSFKDILGFDDYDFGLRLVH